MEGSKTPFYSSELSQACGSVSLKSLGNLVTRRFANPDLLVRLALH